MITKTINIKGTPYKVNFVDALYEVDGLTDTKNKNIYIQKSEDKEELQKTLIHELTHAFFYECGLIQYCNSEILAYWIENNLSDIFNSSCNLIDCLEQKKEIKGNSL